MTTGPNETEVKIRISDLSAILTRLHSAGFRESVPREFEANTLYDTRESGLREKNMLLRLRQFGEHAVITWKGPGIPGPHKSRPELETSIGSVEVLDKILTSIGFQPSFRYEKYRTELRADDGEGVVTVDETPIGGFLELEGSGEWIDRTAQRLGFSPADYVLDSYGRLYLAECERLGIPPHHMVFEPGS